MNLARIINLIVLSIRKRNLQQVDAKHGHQNVASCTSKLCNSGPDQWFYSPTANLHLDKISYLGNNSIKGTFMNTRPKLVKSPYQFYQERSIWKQSRFTHSVTFCGKKEKHYKSFVSKVKCLGKNIEKTGQQKMQQLVLDF